MTTEWLKVMLDEIARKRGEAEQAETENSTRRRERGQDTGSGPETRQAEDRRQGQDRRHAARSADQLPPGPGQAFDTAPR